MFQPISLDSFPKRTREPKEADIEAANALFALIAEGGAANGATDGQTYDSDTKARTAARKTVRLLTASPDFQASNAKVRTRVGKLDGSDGWTYAVYVEAPESNGKSKSK